MPSEANKRTRPVFFPGELSSGSGPFGGLTEQQQEEAVEVILEWIEAQSQAVREGSALAGRALRVIGPAVTHQNVYNGYTEDNAGRYITTRMADWVNENRAYFDMHTHWTTVSMATAAAHRLMGTGGTTPPWDPPYRAVTLEWGPRANGAWISSYQDDFTDFRVDEGCEEPPCCEDDPGLTWDAFVEDWQEDQFDPATDFGFGDVLKALDAAGFNAACYGPTGMHSPSSMAYDMACLIANRVCEDFLDPYREPDPRATLLYDEYVAEVEQYEIDDFEPHPNECPQCEQQ